MSEPKGASTRGSGAKKGPQKYQNVVAFHPNKNSKTDRRIKALPVYGLCTRCTEQILWRKKFRKYKPRTTLGRCVNCQEKNVNEAYHVYCNACATAKKVCAKCLESKEILTSVKDVNSEKNIQRERQEQEQILKTMTERKRRSYLRRLKRGEGEGKEKEGMSGLDDDDDDNDDDDDEDEDEDNDDENEEQKSDKGGKNELKDEKEEEDREEDEDEDEDEDEEEDSENEREDDDEDKNNSDSDEEVDLSKATAQKLKM